MTRFTSQPAATRPASPRPETRSLYYRAESGTVDILDQACLPAQERWLTLCELEDFCIAIRDMQVRGAPLIGITGAFGLALALGRDGSAQAAHAAHTRLLETRPTGVNLRWALQRVMAAAQAADFGAAGAAAALQTALDMVEEDVAACRAIGKHGLSLLQQLDARAGGEPLQVMTHCNAGGLATLEWGTALAPVYAAAEQGIAVHVWVSETRPRNQGLNLTSWELRRAGIDHTVITDNAAGHLMQQGQVDCVLVGSDRTAANGDVCNKIGTYLKALAARDNGIPFYVALPVSTIDFDCATGAAIPIEERAADEVLVMAGLDGRDVPASVRLGVSDVRAANPAFDITPAALVTALVTEQGVIDASSAAIAALEHN